MNENNTELEQLRTAYHCLKQLVQAHQLIKDIDIDWDEFPQTCLSMAHKENLELKERFKLVHSEAISLEKLIDKNNADWNRLMNEIQMENRLLKEALEWLSANWNGVRIEKHSSLYEVTGSRMNGSSETLGEGNTPLQAVHNAMKN